MTMETKDSLIAIGYANGNAVKRDTSNGSSLVSFSISVKKEAEKVWYNCTVWNGSSQYKTAEGITDGDTVYVIGVKRYREYTTREGEVKRATDVTVEKLEVLKKGAPTLAALNTKAEMSEDELPF